MVVDEEKPRLRDALGEGAKEYVVGEEEEEGYPEGSRGWQLGRLTMAVPGIGE